MGDYVCASLLWSVLDLLIGMVLGYLLCHWRQR